MRFAFGFAFGLLLGRGVERLTFTSYYPRTSYAQSMDERLRSRLVIGR